MPELTCPRERFHRNWPHLYLRALAARCGGRGSLAATKINPDTEWKDLPDPRGRKRLSRDYIDKTSPLRGDLRRNTALDIKPVEIQCYLWRVTAKGLPCAASVSKTNAPEKVRSALANKKK